MLRLLTRFASKPQLRQQLAQLHPYSSLSASSHPVSSICSSPSTARHSLAIRPAVLLLPECRRKSPRIGTLLLVPGSLASFHSTPRSQGGPLLPLFAVMLKTTTALEVARTVSRIVLTILPVIVWKNHKSHYEIKHAAIHGYPTSEERKKVLMNRIRYRKMFLYTLLFFPFALFWATIFASLEQTPLTGRWRMIILSPEEEDEIATQLAGPGWYNAVGEILAEDGSPQIISPTDWRYVWVANTLRRLETTIPVLAREPDLDPSTWEGGVESRPMPPPAEHPLRPRPRASEYLRWFCESLCKRHISPVPHSIPGPPYSLLVVDKPEASNAFSYGFGPDGGGGIVVYSGFLDSIFSKMPPEYNAPPPAEHTWLSWFFGGLFSSSQPAPLHPTPTPEQTTELAILLAHELSHLILSHHLETLSSATVVIPGTLSILSDVIRVLIFPITMMFGPFVNDAVAQLGKIGSGELVRVGEYCTSMKQEVEADIVSARLLAHAGFDAREAVKFWENRSGLTSECHSSSKPEDGGSIVKSPMTLAKRIMGTGHPVSEVRVESLRKELSRWESERQIVAARTRTK